MRSLLVLFAFVYCVQIASAATDKVICYHGIWSAYRQNNGYFGVDSIDPSLCTHLIYSFVGILPDGSIRHLEQKLDLSGNIKQFNDLKLKNPRLKTLVAIGGWNEGTVTFSAVAADAGKRARFVEAAVEFCQKWGFDGFDIDWEFPSAFDKQNFAALLKQFREAFDKNNLLLTAAVSATPTSIDNSYDVPSLSKYLDLINVMAYDLHGAWDGRTGQNAPLYPAAGESVWQRENLNVDASIKAWIARGASPQKLTLGLGFYGRTYTLANPGVNGVGAATVNHGNPGPFTQQSGMLGYGEIVEKLAQGGWTSVWDDVQKNPFAFNGNQWVGYDDPKSIAIKVEYAKSLNLAGAMIWSIETDDFRGVSGIKFQLLRAVNAALGNQEVPQPEEEAKPEVTEAPAAKPEVTEAPAAKPVVTTQASNAGGSKSSPCTKEGYVRDPENCSVYHYCLPLNGAFVSFPMPCPGNLVYDPASNSCDHPENVKC